MPLPCVDISVGSRFHAFDLAREMANRSHLGTIHTGYPRFAAARFGLPVNQVRSVWTFEALNRITGSLVRKDLCGADLLQKLSDYFDRVVAKRLRPGADIFVGWSSQCRRSLRRAKQLGMITVVERGSTHIEWQRDILAEEAQLTGVESNGPEASTVAAELAEYAAADYIAVPTQFTVESFVQRGVPREKLLVNPYGVDLQRFSPAADRPASADRIRVLHCGQVSVRKGAHYLADAVQRVAGAELRLVGAVHPSVVPLVRKPRVTLCGPVAGSEMSRQYAEADVFCLLSIEEGMAMVLAQAMASGLPVVATANTGAGELITDGVEGFLVPARDPAAAAEKIQWLMQNPAERQAMGRRARERVCRGYSWSDYGDRALANYGRILRR